MTSAKVGYKDKPLRTMTQITTILWFPNNTQQAPLISTHKHLKNEMDNEEQNKNEKNKPKRQDLFSLVS